MTDICSRDLKDLVREAGRITRELRRIADTLEASWKRKAVKDERDEGDEDEKEE